MVSKKVKDATEFIWDKGNFDKNWIKHNVTNEEAEESFLDKNKVIYKDAFHSTIEERFILLGKTNKERLLYVVFTKRGDKIRVISVRDINKREVQFYEKRA